MALPNYFADQMRAGEAGRADAVRRITGQALTADTPEARNALVQQATQADPTRGVALQKQIDQTADAAAAKAAGAANYVIQAVKTGNPAQIAGAYRNALPYLSRLAAEHGQTAPAEYSDEQLPGLHQLAAAGAVGAMGGDMKSLTPGPDGTFWAIKNGQFQSTGIAVPPNYQLRDQPGLAPAMIDTRRNVVAPLGAGTPGMVAAPGAPPAAPSAAPAMAPGEVPFAIDPSLPPAAQAAIRTAESTGQPMPDQIKLPPQPAAAGPDTSLTAARPAVSPAEAERLALAREANARAEESARLARQAAEDARIARERGTLPAGMRWGANGVAEQIPGTAPPAGAGGSEDERKAAGWYAQASKALDDMDAALKKEPGAAVPGAIEAYSPVAEVANRARSPARQQYVQAASALSEAVLRAATGAGVNESEARQKIAELTPQRGDSDEVIRQKQASARMYLRSLHTRAGRALQNTTPTVDRRPAGGAPRRATNPKTGEVVELRGGQWVPVR